MRFARPGVRVVEPATLAAGRGALALGGLEPFFVEALHPLVDELARFFSDSPHAWP